MEGSCVGWVFSVHCAAWCNGVPRMYRHCQQSQGYYHKQRHSSLAWCCRLCPGLYQSLTKVHSRDKMQFWIAVAGWRDVFMMNSAKAGSRPSLTLSSSDSTSSLARTDITSPFFSSFVSYNLKMFILLMNLVLLIVSLNKFT